MKMLGNERKAVQEPTIKYAQEIGWNYVSPDDALNLRNGKTGIVFRDIFIKQMKKLNDFITDELADELIKQIHRIPANIEGNLIAWEYLKGLRTVFVPDEKRERNVKFIDADNIENNTFHVTDEFSFYNGYKENRPDIVFLINGVPVLIIETKATYLEDGIARALDQIKRYHRETPELMAILQLYVVTHLIRFYYSVTWNESRKNLFNWKEEAEGNFERLVKVFFDRKRVVKFINDFILFVRQDDELKKVVLRPHQMRAVEKIVQRAMDKQKRRGLIWHTQGSGKTYTMIVAAKKILENPLFENPTVIMLVDRNELESQLFGNLKSVGIEHMEVARSKAHLQELLKRDRRGLIVSMIHKFDDMPKDINTRYNIFVLVDEAHRTTGGKLGNYLMGALPNATYIGFTGTPIDKTSYGRGTFITFGIDDPPKGYLDKYSIAQSIEDETTVPLHYSLAPNELRVNKETLEKEFLDIAEYEGMADVEALNKVLEKAVNLRNELKSRDRIKKIAEYVANHYREYIEPMGYKAFLVAVDREACAMYKEELDKHLPPEYSVVVYSRAQNDPPELQKYYLSDEEEKRVRKAFRKPDALPKILIVTEKLLTGFDAPILYCMYLDKPMRDHVLLQAIARVNRPYEDEQGRKKPCGFVLDFVGIFDNLKKALAFDSSDIEGVVRDIQVLKEEFAQLMKEAREKHLSIIEGKSGDKLIETLLEYFLDKEKREEFYKFFKKISTIYEIISPDAFLRPYLEDYEKLVRMYRIVRANYEPRVDVDKEFERKTAKLVQKHTESSEIGEPTEIYEINDGLLRKIEESHKPDIEKVFNLVRSIERTVQKEGDKDIYLISIGEKAERIAELFKERQKTTQETLEELKNLIQEINEARKEQIEKKLPSEIFSIYWIFKKEGISNPEERASKMKDFFDKYPHWRKSEVHEREIRKGLYKVLLDANIDDIAGMVDKIMRLLKGGEYGS
ncbi:MAG TPA: HsdR family type I site-specific deoxyribonuclease [Thermoplasmata archaeon]|nr:HsdR family type I site-specific deoxyribonuclease [Thermoplasmata archaeon]